MKKFVKALLAAALLAVVASACGGGEENSVPRRRAYARVDTYPAEYRAVEVGGIPLEINTSAAAASPREGWLDVRYPRYGATLHLAVARPDAAALDQAVANRRQRMSLNLGGATAEQTTLAGDSYVCELLVSRDAVATPVQLLAVGADGTLVSGAAVIAGRTEPVDSLRPVVEALRADALHLLMHLK